MSEVIIDLPVVADAGVSLRYQTAGAAGMDLTAKLESPVRIGVGQRVPIPTGVRVAIPAGYEGTVRPRSGLVFKHGVMTAFGTIDSDYRGELVVLLMNFGDMSYVINPGDRIAQLVISSVSRANVVPVEVLPETDRGSNGFGSTGVA